MPKHSVSSKKKNISLKKKNVVSKKSKFSKKSQYHSVLKLFTGFATAARIA